MQHYNFYMIEPYLVVVRSSQLNVICHERSNKSEENYKVRETFLLK